MDVFETERKKMVDEQIRGRGLRDQCLLSAFEAVPRHLFVPEEYRHLAYADGPLPIGHGQTISQPYIVALMTHLLELTGSERVLEIGTGSGYQAAILSKLAREVHAMEIIPELAMTAEKVLCETDCMNVHVHLADGSLGWLAAAPYDAILVAAAAPSAPQPLLDQLIDDGRMVVPVGGQGYQELEVWKREEEILKNRTVVAVSFVPLRGAHGWRV